MSYHIDESTLTEVWSRSGRYVTRETKGLFGDIRRSVYDIVDVPRKIRLLMEAYDTDRVGLTAGVFAGQYVPLRPTVRRTRVIVEERVVVRHHRSEPSGDVVLGALLGAAFASGVKALASRSRAGR